MRKKKKKKEEEVLLIECVVRSEVTQLQELTNPPCGGGWVGAGLGGGGGKGRMSELPFVSWDTQVCFAQLILVHGKGPGDWAGWCGRGGGGVTAAGGGGGGGGRGRAGYCLGTIFFVLLFSP